MPDFENIKPKTCKRSSIQSQAKFEPFKLRTEGRGTEKKSKFMRELEKKEEEER